jgi:hypothetical protein
VATFSGAATGQLEVLPLADLASLHPVLGPSTTYTALLASATAVHERAQLVAVSVTGAEPQSGCLDGADAISLPYVGTTGTLMLEELATLINDGDMCTYIDLADKPQHKKGKWSHMFALFKQNYPHSSLNLEAFRSRVSRSAQKRKFVVSSTHGVNADPQPMQVQSSQPAKKRSKGGACESCRRQCGPNGDCNGPRPLQAPLLEEAWTWCSESIPIDERYSWSKTNCIHWEASLYGKPPITNIPGKPYPVI